MNYQIHRIGIVFDQIPGIGRDFIIQLIQKIRRTIQIHYLVSAQTDPEKMIEPDEMIHMGMGDKDMGNL
jgi:hypothetical protein